jgi:hypothetical protein
VALSAFEDTSHPPGAGELKRMLGKSAPLWDQLIAETREAHAPITEDWNFAGAKYGWSLRLKQRDRVVLYMTPQAGQFLLGVALGGKAVAAADASVPASVRALIDDAPRYAEGRGIRFAVTKRADVAAAGHLAALKMRR